MSDASLPTRRYSEKEIGLLLRRAAEIQASDPTGRAAAGLTLAELEEVAAEVGIESGYLRRAATELEARGVESLGARLAGAPLSFVLERRIPGELSPTTFEELIPVLGAAAPGQGSVSAVGRTLTFSSRSDANTSSQQVTISVRGGETTVRIEERLGGLAGALHGGIVAGVGAGLGVGAGVPLGLALGGAVVAVALPAIVVGGAYAGARAFFAAGVRRRRYRAEALLESLAERVAELVRRDLSAAPADRSVHRSLPGPEADRR